MNRKDWRNKKIKDLVIYFCPRCNGSQEECSCCQTCHKPVNKNGLRAASDIWCDCILIEPVDVWTMDTQISPTMPYPRAVYSDNSFHQDN